MEIDPERIVFTHLVVRPIKNGYLVEVETESDDETYSFKSYRQVLCFLKTLEAK